MDKEYTVKVRAERGMSVDLIAQTTGLSIEEVNKILGNENESSRESVSNSTETNN